jgi:Tol biopolymer transport system component
VVTRWALDLFLVDPERSERDLEEAVRRRRGGAGHGARRLFRAGDGRFLYFTKYWDYLGPLSVNAIWRMPVEGGDETLVVPRIKSYRNFVVGRRTIYYAQSESGRDSIRAHDLGTGRDRVLVELSKPIAAGMSLSPDERFLLFSQVDDEGSELMLVDNFR